MAYQNLKIWVQAIRFYFTHWRDLLLIFPLLFLPVLGDGLHSVLIYQKIKHGEIHPLEAMKIAIKSTPTLFVMKLYFEGLAVLWAFIPIYGYIKAYELRTQWALASNVIIFEGLTGERGIEQCKKLFEQIPEGIAARTLVTIPGVILSLCLILFAIATSIFETSHVFWFFMIAVLIIAFPLSGAVNTHLYLVIPDVKDRLNL
jgi:hypothetical protein